MKTAVGLRRPRPACRRPWGAATLALLSLLAAVGAAAPPARAETATAQIIVAREAGVASAQRGEIRAAAGADFVRRVPLLAHTEVVEVPADRLDEALARLNADPNVRYAEYDAPVRAFDEPLEHLQYGLRAIDAGGAAALGAAGAGVTVAVVDTGLDLGHPDLADRVATNPGETGGGRETNGFDDDRNGLIDDWRGWDWVGDDNVPEDRNGHGTHVSGIVAASRNGTGIAGVAPSAFILPVRTLNADGAGSTSDVASALAYAGRVGAPIATVSLGGNSSGRVEDDAMRAHPGTLYVAAAGNDGADNDAILSYPCNSTAVNVICVGASGRADEPASFSNFGRRNVDLFAPGVEIVSTFPGGYAEFDGTSFSAPHVSGAAALLRGAKAGMSALAMKNALLAGADRLEPLVPLSVTGGRLNAHRALTIQPGDGDGDGIGDVWDVCPAVPDPGQEDVDSDGVGDVCQDRDADGVPDARDQCPREAAPRSRNGCLNTVDTDSDGILDIADSCPTAAGNGSPDGCPVAAPRPITDADGDGRADSEDACPQQRARTASGCPRPVLRRVSVDAIRCRTRACRPRIKLRVTLDRPARVTGELQRRRCRSVCRWTKVEARAGAFRRTSGTIRFRTRLVGRMRVRVVARLGPERSIPKTRTVKAVRTR